jgi:pilus assembly protein CpaB
MRRGRTLIFVILIIIIGLVVGYVAIRQFLVAATPAVQQPTNVEVYIAGQNIPQGGKITEEVLTTITVPQDKVVAVMFTREELGALINNKVAKFPLDQGVVITESMVNDASAAVPISGPQWASLIPPGMTAMSLPISRLAVSGYAINDGAHVNLNACFLFVDVDPSFQTSLPNQTALLTGTGIGTVGGSVAGTQGTGFATEGLPILSLGVAASGSPQGRLELDPSLQQPYYLVPSEAQRPRMVCQTLLQDVVVMKLGSFPLTTTDSAVAAAPVVADPNAAPAPAPVAPDIITLIVSPQDSITLTYIMYTNARISLTLRNPTDLARNATEASTLQFLLSQYNIPVPAKLPYTMDPALRNFPTSFATPCLLNDVCTPASP